MLERYKDSNIGSHSGYADQTAASSTAYYKLITSAEATVPQDQSLICVIKFWQENVDIK